MYELASVMFPLNEHVCVCVCVCVLLLRVIMMSFVHHIELRNFLNTPRT